MRGGDQSAMSVYERIKNDGFIKSQNQLFLSFPRAASGICDRRESRHFCPVFDSRLADKG